MHRTILAVSTLLLLAGADALLAQGQGTTLQPDPSRGTTRVGTRGANFMEIGVGARALALGGAITAAEGVTSYYWNPAAVMGIEGIAAGVSHSELYQGSGVGQTFAAVAMPLGSSVLGISFISFTSGDVEVTTEQWPTGGDPSAAHEVSWFGHAFGLHYARSITDRLNVGLTGRYLEEGITGATADYVGFDLATVFRTGLYGVTLSAAVSNLGTSSAFRGSAVTTEAPSSPNFGPLPSGDPVSVELETQTLQLPTTVRVGAYTELVGAADALMGANPEHSVLLHGQISDAVTTAIQPSFGLEYGFREMVFARVGKEFRNSGRASWGFTSGLAGGLGVRLPVSGRAIAIDYAYVEQGELLGQNHVFSVEYGF